MAKLTYSAGVLRWKTVLSETQESSLTSVTQALILSSGHSISLSQKEVLLIMT